MKRHMKYVHEREELRSVTFVKIGSYYTLICAAKLNYLHKCYTSKLFSFMHIFHMPFHIIRSSVLQNKTIFTNVTLLSSSLSCTYFICRFILYSHLCCKTKLSSQTQAPTQTHTHTHTHANTNTHKH